MKIGSIQLEKRVVMTVAIISMLMSGCEDRFDSGRGNPAGGGEPVEVNLNIGFADEADGYELSSKAGGTDHEGAFDCELVPSALTRSGFSVKPDALYNLEIRQYKSDGAYLNGGVVSNNAAAIGSRITVTLSTATKCQLVLVAWGKDNPKRLNTGNLSAAQDTTLEASVIKDLDPAVQADMNKMPYVLHLKDVNVSNNGRIYSNEGEAIDVRLRLKRLAARLTFDWTYSVSDYTPQQILIQGVPTDYKVVASPDKKDNTYPSLLDQFTTIQIPITDSQTAGQTTTGIYSCWIPANVRGTSSAASTATSRTKANAPTGSSYIRLIAVNSKNVNQKLDYRIYLGGKESTDFNVCENTNYIYTATFNHTDLPVNDRRVTIVDPSPASEGNSNLVNTANCFMIPPGGAFCFNPYKYTQNGAVVDNTVLQGWCNDDNAKIQSVKVLWQTLENGDIGDPVLGTVNSSIDHTNIVELKDGSDFEKALIYCRVAPGTTGGSGVIVACSDTEGKNILWSWHIWVTDYAPDATANATVNEPANKRIQKYTYGNKTQYPMMDRNLGAQAGYTTAPDGDLARSKANGFHYQFGRKDPFPSTYSSSIKEATLVINSDALTPGMLNYYQPDGISYFVRNSSDKATTIRGTFQNPTTLYAERGKVDSWCSTLTDVDNLWYNSSSANVKTVYDPCPAGWRVASKLNYRSLFTTTSYSESASNDATTAMNLANSGKFSTDGGAVVYFEQNNGGNSTYIRLTGYQEFADKFSYIGTYANLWCREPYQNNMFYALHISIAGASPAYNISRGWRPRDAHPLRCIQDR